MCINSDSEAYRNPCSGVCFALSQSFWSCVLKNGSLGLVPEDSSTSTSVGNFFWLSLPELVQSSTGLDLAAALTWRQGASSLGKQFLGLNGKEELSLLTGSALPWALRTVVDLGLFTQTCLSTVQERVILSTRWFSRIEKQLLLLPAYEMLPCLSYLLLEAAALLSRPKPNCLLFNFSSQTSFSSFDRIFRFQYVTSVSNNFFLCRHQEAVPGPIQGWGFPTFSSRYCPISCWQLSLDTEQNIDGLGTLLPLWCQPETSLPLLEGPEPDGRDKVFCSLAPCLLTSVEGREPPKGHLENLFSSSDPFPGCRPPALWILPWPSLSMR